MTSLPTPAEALERSLDAFENGDRDAARYWLAVATELRAGNPPKPVVHVFDAQNLAAGAEQLERQAQAAASDATAVMNVASDGACPSCGGETFIAYDGSGRAIHRSTYKEECEFATVGR